MMPTIPSRLITAAALCGAVLLPCAVDADDRRLITGFEEIPTVFFMFDTSGSMHWSAQCTQAEFDAGTCDYLCPTGDCWLPGSGDHPSSKLYLAKEAIYEVISQTNDLNVGFATYNQDRLRIPRKHWTYQALEDGPNIPGYGPYPRGQVAGPPLVAGDVHTFGTTWACTTGSGPDNVIGCAGDTPADLDDMWERQRVEALPKNSAELNGNSDASTTFFVRSAGETYEIQMTDRAVTANNLGDATITIDVRRRHCLNDSCSSFDQEATVAVDFGLVTDFSNWDFVTARGPARAGMFSQGTASDGRASNTCLNWDSNTDSADDPEGTTNLRWDTVADGDFPGLLDVGDVLPIDWRNDNRQALLERLAPNLVGDPAAPPDFRVATYFNDDPVGGLLQLRDPDERPILAFGATPIGTVVKSFHDWMEGTTGWVDTAAANDPSAACRETYLVMITDGNQSTCDGDDPCSIDGTHELFTQLGVQTFVVAFGVPPHVPYLPRCTGSGDETPNVTCCAGDGLPTCFPSDDPNLPPDEWPVVTTPPRENRSLRCMASTGGTGNEDYDRDGTIDGEGPGVIYPQNKDELVNALVSILDQIRPKPTAFATAAVPSVQAEAADKVFLTEFTPVPERSQWIGEVNAFLKPVPIDADNKPDTSRICPTDDLEDPTDDPSACLLWEAGEVILNEQYNAADPIGDLLTQRRVYYSEFGNTVPRRRHYFEETVGGGTPAAQEFDLWRAFDLAFDELDTATHGPARDAANAIIDSTLSVKTTPLNDDFPVPIDYLLTDIFHSDPLFFGSPNNLLNFIQDVDGYREFSIEHAFRRRILFFGANGGMLHALDAGVCRELVRDDPRPCLFDNGSGRELFAYVPRTAMPTVRELTEGLPRHRFSVDGRTQAADVRIDPIHDGPDSLANPPNESDREWRTVLIGGLREGGNIPPESRGDISSPEDSNPNDNSSPVNQPMSGYFALDITQPDPLPTVGPGESPIPLATGVEPPDCLRSIDGITPAVSGCGPVAFGATLWEFTDTIEGVRLDEDDNGYVDLAFAWSNPTFGRIRACLSGCSGPDPTLEDRHVMVIGGGFDPRAPYQRGNHLYLIDVETGEPIYKHKVMGAIAAEPAAVDTNFDGYLDTIYAGTSLGLLYRVTLDPLDQGGSDPKYPQLEPVLIEETAWDGTVVSRTLPRITDPDFGPFVILETSDPLAVPPEVRPIFYRPSVIFLQRFNRYAVALGTGDRENLFRRQQPSGRFFVFVDDVTPAEIMSPAFVPFSPVSTELTPLTQASPNFNDNTNLLIPGEGWWLELSTDERLVTEPFALSGILFFSTFIPDPGGPTVIPDGSLCREAGESNIYGVFTTNADGLLSDDEDIDDPNNLVRYITVSGLVSAPYTEQSATKNPPPDDDTIDTIDNLSDRLKFIRDRLKAEFPGNCTFPPGYRIDVKTRNSQTGIDFIAPVPICVVEKSFREF